MPQTIKPMGLIHLPGTGPNNRFDFKNKGNNRANEARGSCWHGYQQKGLKKKGNKMVPNCVKEEAAGVGIITKQNTTQDVKPGETTRQANKLHLGLTKKGLPARGMREDKHSADLKLKNGKYMILQADDEESIRGLAVKSNADGSYDTYYWYQDPDKKMPIEIEIDGKSVDKDAKVVHWKYHPELKENFADKKVKGKSRPGRVKRSGASCKGSVSSLRAKAKKYGGERGKMYHWCANMKSGRKKKK